jgi:hypothetical protein
MAVSCRIPNRTEPDIIECTVNYLDYRALWRAENPYCELLRKVW